MKKTILGIIVVSMITAFGCEKKTEISEEKEVLKKEEAVTQKEETKIEPEAIKTKEGEAESEIPIKVKEESIVPEKIDIASLLTKASDVVIIDNKGYEKDLRDPVKFEHKKHSEEYINIEGGKIGCTECHHIYKDGKNVWKEGNPVQGCASNDCHDPLEKIDNRLKLQLAYHRNCQECHLALIKAGKKTEDETPTKCNQCMHN